MAKNDLRYKKHRAYAGKLPHITEAKGPAKECCCVYQLYLELFLVERFQQQAQLLNVRVQKAKLLIPREPKPLDMVTSTIVYLHRNGIPRVEGRTSNFTASLSSARDQ